MRGKNREILEAKAEQIDREIFLGTFDPARHFPRQESKSRMTFRQLYQEWRKKKANEVAPLTLAWYAEVVEGKILPFFGAKRLDDFSPALFDRFKAGLIGGTLSPRLLASAQRLVPAVERTIWLHTEPEIAMRRDGEFSAGYYQELHAGYRLAAGQYGWDVIRTSGRPQDAIAADIGRLLGLDVWGRAADGSISAGQAPLATAEPLRSAETAVVRDP